MKGTDDARPKGVMNSFSVSGNVKRESERVTCSLARSREKWYRTALWHARRTDTEEGGQDERRRAEAGWATVLAAVELRSCSMHFEVGIRAMNGVCTTLSAPSGYQDELEMRCISNPLFLWQPSESSLHCRGTAGFCATVL